MKKYCYFLALVCILTVVAVQAQPQLDYGENPPVLRTGPVSDLDNAVRTLAFNLHRSITAEGAGSVGIGQFSYRGNNAPLGEYWHNQLIAALANIPDRPYTILSALPSLPGAADAEWTISGEIIEAPGIYRIFTRLIRSSDRAIAAAFQSDMERSMEIHQMLATGGAAAWTSSWEFPINFEIGQNSSVPVMNRSLAEDGEDHFLLIPAAEGRLVVETTGSIDTYMRFYDAESRELFAENDDGGSGRNARIEYTVEAGRRYMAVVSGYNSNISGNYGFRAFSHIVDNHWDNPLLFTIGEDANVPVMARTLQRGGEDFFLLIPAIDGRLTAETTGNTDTFMEFYDGETRELLDRNDDGGSGVNARIRYEVEAGHRYIAKVRGYSSGTSGDYNFRAFIQTGDAHWDNLIPFEIGSDERQEGMTRMLNPDDEHFFLLIPASDGRLTAETTGDTDTFIEFYDAESQELLVQNDDGGFEYNARIRYTVEAGRRYIAMVRGFSSRTSGEYTFLAYLIPQIELLPDEFEPNDEPDSAGWIEIGVPQTHTFHHVDDVDWVRFRVDQGGQFIIRARGVNSDRLDTYIELFDANLNLIAEDDDGGDFVDSRLTLRLNSGVYFLKVWFLGDEPDQPYTISITRDE